MSFSTRHWRHAMVMGLLVLTGFSLYLASWRSALGPLMPVAQAVHEWGGVLYGLAVLGWSGRFYPWPADRNAGTKAPGFTKWAFFFLVMLFVSGLGLLVGPSWTRAIATIVHGLFAAAFVLWVAYHLAVHWPVNIRRKKPHVNLARRRTLRWLVGAAVTVPVLGAIPSVLTMLSGRMFHQGSNSGALPGFVPYTVVGGYPDLSLETWRLSIEGKHYTMEDLKKFGAERRHVNFQCVTGWAVDGVEFTGIDLDHFLRQVGWNSQTHPWVMFFSGDGVYTESLDVQQIAKYQPLLAYQIDSRPLPQSQGYPLRLLVPGMYGYKSIKWLVGIKLVSQDTLGYWEQRGYPQNAYLGSYSGI